MILSWKNNRGLRAASGRLAVVQRGSARLARPFRRALPWVRPGYRRRALFRRRLLTGLLTTALLVAAVLIAHNTALRLNGAVVLAQRELPGMPVFFCQEDPAWSGDPMGPSGRALGEAGDGVTCLASLIAMQQLPTPIDGAVNPGSLNAWLSSCGAYDAQGNLDWSKAARLLGAELTERQPGWGVSRALEWLLQREIYPVVRVRRADTGAFHDVLVVGTVHGEFVIVDPLDASGTPNTLGIYDNRIYAVRYLK